MARALIVSPSVDSRLPLAQVASRTAIFRDVLSVHNFEEAQKCIRGSEKFNCIFMAQDFGPNEIAGFIERAKKAPACEECAFVLVLKSDERTTDVVSQHMLVGIHSFVSEPLSVKGIEEAAKMGNAVRMQTSAVRMKAATGLMLSEVLSESEPAVPGAPKPNMWDRVQDSCQKFKELTGQSVTVSIVDDMQKLEPSQRLPRYGGASKRVRAAFERKLREHLLVFKKNKDK